MDLNKYSIVNDNGEGVYEVNTKNSNIHYYVNENKKTVAAVMKNCKGQVRRELHCLVDKIYPSDWGEADLVFDCEIERYMKNTYKGKAHCIKDDIFDLETGMAVARAHMLAEFYCDRTNCMAAVSDRLNELMLVLEERIGLSLARAEKFIDASNEFYINAHK